MSYVAVSPMRREEFRRPSGVVRRRRRAPILVLLRAFLQATLLVGAPGALLYWLLTAPRFSVSDIEVATGQRVGSAWVESTLAPTRGGNLFLLSLPRVEKLLETHPWVGAVRVRKELPNTLFVEIEERVPEAVGRSAEGWIYLDAQGRPIAPVEEDDPGGLLRIVGSADTPRAAKGALDAAHILMRARPQWGLELEEVEVLGPEDFRLRVAELSFPLVVRPETLEVGVRHLVGVLPELEARLGVPVTVDLRDPRRIVLEPAPHSREGVAAPIDT